MAAGRLMWIQGGFYDIIVPFNKYVPSSEGENKNGQWNY